MSELMASGVQLMLVGMGTVFFFLTTLVFVTMLMSYLLRRFVPVPVSSDTAVSSSQDEEVAAIASALHLHQNPRK